MHALQIRAQAQHSLVLSSLGSLRNGLSDLGTVNTVNTVSPIYTCLTVGGNDEESKISTFLKNDAGYYSGFLLIRYFFLCNLPGSCCLLVFLVSTC